MITSAEERALASAFPVFRNLSESLRRELRDGARHVSVPASATLFQDGAPCQAYPLLLRGSVRVSKASAAGREMVLDRIAPGQLCLLTTSCLLGQACYPARGMAETACDLLLLEPACFHRLLSAHDDFRRLVFSLFSARVTELMQRVEEVAFAPLDRRLAALLLRSGSELTLSHQMLADELGSVRVVVSRLLREFEERGWVKLGRQRICILQPSALRALAKQDSPPV